MACREERSQLGGVVVDLAALPVHVVAVEVIGFQVGNDAVGKLLRILCRLEVLVVHALPEIGRDEDLGVRVALPVQCDDVPDLCLVYFTLCGVFCRAASR